MTVYIGCDFHPYQQTVAFCDSNDAVINFKTLRHADRQALHKFYSRFAAPVVVGVEACGKLRWFE